MARWVYVVLSAIMMTQMCACGDTGAHSGDETTKAQSTAATTATATTATATTAAAASTSQPPADTTSASTAPAGGKVDHALVSVQPEPFYYSGLVELTQLDDSFIIDLRYATENNFTGIAHYKTSLCLVQSDVAPMLLKASALAAEKGYRIKVFDLYRPVSVQQALHDAAPPHLSAYVPAPNEWAQHSRGIAVDCTLTDLAGNELDMPSDFDDFSEKAHVDYAGASDTQKQNRAELISIMRQCGFEVNALEWWHFYKPSYSGYPILDVNFDEYIEARKAAHMPE